MKFKVNERLGTFGKFNPRNENHGKEKKPAGDIPVTFKGGKRDLDMLFPMVEGKMSKLVWTEKGELNAPYLKLLNARLPEDVDFTVYDQNTSRAKPIELEGCKIKIKDVQIERKFNLVVGLLIQFHDDVDSYSARLRYLMDQERRFTLEAKQDDFWDKAPDDEDDEDGQGELEVETEEDEEEDTDTDEDEED